MKRLAFAKKQAAINFVEVEMSKDIAKFTRNTAACGVKTFIRGESDVRLVG